MRTLPFFLFRRCDSPPTLPLVVSEPDPSDTRLIAIERRHPYTQPPEQKMARSNRDDFDAYRKWLGISNQKRLPTHYELLAISLDEDDPDVIQAAAQQRRHFVESKRGEGHDDLVTEILYRIDEAESTLLNTALRRDYDRKMDLFEKRQKSRQVDPVARQSRKFRGVRTVGEDGGIVKTFASIVAIICVAFGGMAWFGFRVQPKPANQEQHVPAAEIPAIAPPQIPAVPVVPPVAESVKPNLTDRVGELMAFEGHNEPVWCVAFAPDGKRVLSGSGKKIGEYSIRLWEAESGKEIQQFLGHTDTVRTVAFSPDGARIVSGSWDKTIRLWDLTTGKTIRVLQGHADAITGGIAFSDDGTRIFSGSIDGTARMWDVETGNELKSFEAKHEIHCIALSPNGLQLLTGGLRKWDDGDQKKAEAVLILWDMTTGQQIRRFSGGTAMNTICFSPDGKEILSAGPDWTMRLWDVASGSEIKTFEGHAGCFTPNGKYAFGDRKDELLTLWNLETGAEVARFKGHRAICVAVSKDGRRALSGGFDNTVRVLGLPKAAYDPSGR